MSLHSQRNQVYMAVIFYLFSAPAALAQCVPGNKPFIFHGVLALFSASVFVGLTWMSLIRFSNFPWYLRDQASDRPRREHGKRRRNLGTLKDPSRVGRGLEQPGLMESVHFSITISALQRGGRSFSVGERTPGNAWGTYSMSCLLGFPSERRECWEWHKNRASPWFEPKAPHWHLCQGSFSSF